MRGWRGYSVEIKYGYVSIFGDDPFVDWVAVASDREDGVTLGGRVSLSCFVAYEAMVEGEKRNPQRIYILGADSQQK